MIEKCFEVGTFTIFNRVLKKEAPIKLIVTAYDVDPQDWKPSVDPRTGEVLPGKPQTIGELKQRWGEKLQVPIRTNLRTLLSNGIDREREKEGYLEEEQ
jgi:hypothetical protein